jgi:two-component system cell cycle sensor histidine kinase/response regulator CckA
VDDEPDLVYLFKDALSQIEDTVVFAFTDPALALEHFSLNHEDYGLLISDYRMPGMCGTEFFQKARKIKPTIPTILISAFEVEDNIFENCDCVNKFLQKPITIADLIREVQTYTSVTENRRQRLR